MEGRVASCSCGRGEVAVRDRQASGSDYRVGRLLQHRNVRTAGL